MGLPGPGRVLHVVVVVWFHCCAAVQLIAINQDELGVAGDIIWKVGTGGGDMWGAGAVHCSAVAQQ